MRLDDYAHLFASPSKYSEFIQILEFELSGKKNIALYTEDMTIRAFVTDEHVVKKTGLCF